MVRLVRDRSAAPQDGSESAPCDPGAGRVEPGALDGVDAVVHLAGAGVGDKRWTAARKREIRDSRVRGTDTIARACAASACPPRILVPASATGYYGDTGERTVEQSEAAGHDSLSSVCVEPRRRGGGRRAGTAGRHPSGPPAHRAGRRRPGRRIRPALPALPPRPGRRLGSGDQYWPFSSLTDHVAALRFTLDTEELSGPVNFTAPEPLTNREVTQALGRALHRPALAAVPAFVLRPALGEFAAGITCSARVVPAALRRAVFTFAHPTIDAALDSVLRPAA